VSLLILDSFIAYGPLRVFLLRAFNQTNLRKQETRRFLSQVGVAGLWVRRRACSRGWRPAYS
jgi:hypothetical protein